ncbi:PQQ-binding-like beta-propeller repeat protein [bacterium]|nr:PQQ-binding-like beta-propeller repeat protein [bacterium]
MTVWVAAWMTLAPALANAATTDARAQASDILRTAGVAGGLVVHLGCGDGTLTAALHASESYSVHGLDTSAANVAKARTHIASLGLYGKVAVDQFDGTSLPYIDNLANLVVADGLGRVPMAEVMRVLCPQGVACVKKDGQWTATVKPRPKDIDEWTHFLHDASNNPVANDTVVAPPRRLQWVGSPRYGRHHDRMSSVSAVVSAGGRVFTIFDEASRISILVPPQWKLIARDAFNGTLLWKRPIDTWHPHLTGLKSGPAVLPRRLVAVGNRVYVTLGLDAPVSALDAATGETVRVYKGTEAAQEILVSDGVLFVVAGTGKAPAAQAAKWRGRPAGPAWWAEGDRRLVALEPDTGKVLWSTQRSTVPLTLAATPQGLFACSRDRIVCLDRTTGKPVWESEPVPRGAAFPSYYSPTLVVQDGVVLFAGGETAAKKARTWYTEGEDTMTALSAKTGSKLWSAYHPPSGYASPEDVFVARGLVWTGETTSGRAVGVFTGRDLHTGEVKSQFPPDVKTYWFHHRCHRGKATVNFLLPSRAGIEFIDFRNRSWDINHWVRGACLYGIMPCNGLVYAPQHPCACYLESKLSGFNALAPAGKALGKDTAPRLIKGPAHGTIANRESQIGNSSDWPTYRRDATRSGYTDAAVPTALKESWKTDLGGRLSSPVVAAGRLFVASIDSHLVHALDANTGAPLWQFAAGGRVDSPPTVWRGRVLFGSADGHVYCLRASDGALAWRFRAAPHDRRLMSFEQLESVWPVHGSVLVHGGAAYCVAGRSMFLDGGLRLYRLDPATGRVLSETVLDDREEGTGKKVQDFVSWLNMPTALPDVLSCDGRFVYMRSQPFGLDGKRLPLEAMPHGANADAGAPPATQNPKLAHLFSPTGFLDDSWWHRTYWLYGSRFVSGWQGYYRAGKATPSGRILVFDATRLYGFGRKPAYYRWTTPIEHHLFATDKVLPTPDRRSAPTTAETRVHVAKSQSLSPAATPLTVEAWVKAEQPSGVVLAHGGGAQGYTLFIDDGHPCFGVKVGGKPGVAKARQKVTGRWAHLAGVLADGKVLQVFVDGKLAGTAKAPGFLPGNPIEPMQIGADDETCVGPYEGPLAFGGVIDEVRVYHRALDAKEIAQRAAGPAPEPAPTDKRVLSLSFDDGTAQDASGSSNHGKVAGAKPVAGKLGGALQFTGGGARRPAGFEFAHHWTRDVPLHARAMVLARDTLFIAGPPDTFDETQMQRRMADPAVEKQVAAYVDALAGKGGAQLWAVDTAKGSKLSALALGAPPVFDGMAATPGRLYVCMVDGAVACLVGE